MKRLLSLLLAATICSSILVPALAQGDTMEATSVQYAVYPEAENTATALHFEDLRDVILEYNYTVSYLKSAMSDASDVDSDDLYDAVAGLETLKTMLEELQQTAYLASTSLDSSYGNFSNVSSDGIDVDIGDLSDAISGDLGIVYATLYQMFYVEIASLDSQIASLESSAVSLDTTIDTTKNTLNSSINQLVKGAQSLYIGIVTMEVALEDIDRGLAAMDRAIALFEAQYERGLVSLFELESIQYQKRMLQSQRESLVFQISTTKMTLESMCGMTRTGNVTLYDITLPTSEDLADVNYDTYLTQAMGQNVDVMNAEAEYFGNINDTTYKRAYTVAMDNFYSSFYLVCITVPEKSRLVSVAEDTVAYQNRALEITTKSYELGMSSQEEYLTALDTVATAQSDLYKAQLDVFSAYCDFVAAKTYGIV